MASARRMMLFGPDSVCPEFVRKYQDVAPNLRILMERGAWGGGDHGEWAGVGLVCSRNAVHREIVHCAGGVRRYPGISQDWSFGKRGLGRAGGMKGVARDAGADY